MSYAEGSIGLRAVVSICVSSVIVFFMILSPISDATHFYLYQRYWYFVLAITSKLLQHEDIVNNILVQSFNVVFSFLSEKNYLISSDGVFR